MMYILEPFREKCTEKSVSTRKENTQDDHVPTLPASSRTLRPYTHAISRVHYYARSLAPQHYYCAMLLSLRKCAIASGSAFSFFHAATCLKI